MATTDESLFNVDSLPPLRQPAATHFLLRPLQATDYHKGFLQVLEQLTVVGSVEEAAFVERFHRLKATGCSYIVVVEDKQRRVVVATAALYLEPKFLRSCGTVGHIEDVVVLKECRGLHIGELLIQVLKDVAIARGCYKVILDCAEHNVKFYEKCGFARKELQMAYYTPTTTSSSSTTSAPIASKL